MADSILDNAKAQQAGLVGASNVRDAKQKFMAVYDMLQALTGKLYNGSRRDVDFPVENSPATIGVINRIMDAILGLDMMKNVNMHPVMNMVLNGSASIKDPMWMFRKSEDEKMSPWQTYSNFRDLDLLRMLRFQALVNGNRDAFNNANDRAYSLIFNTIDDIPYEFITEVPMIENYFGGAPGFDESLWEANSPATYRIGVLDNNPVGYYEETAEGDDYMDAFKYLLNRYMLEGRNVPREMFFPIGRQP